MPRVRVQTVALTFSAVDTSESARQPVQYADTNGTARALDAGVVEVVHAERTAGALTVVFTVRVYSAAAAGKMRVSEAISLDAAGVGMQAFAAGLRRYLDAGAWVTVQAGAGAAHALAVQLQVAPATGG